MGGAEDMRFDVEHVGVGAKGTALIATGLVEGGKVVLDYSNFVVLGSVLALPDAQRPLEDCLGLGVAPLSEKQRSEHGEVGCGTGGF